MPACTVIVGQSMMNATVTWLLEGNTPCSWESLLEEGSTSLKILIHLLSHWSDHLSCSNQCAGVLSSPSCSSWGVAFFLSCWNINLICVIHVLKICRIVKSVTYYNLRIHNPKSCDVSMIYSVTDAVCHEEVCGCILCVLSEIIVGCFCVG